MIADAVDDAFAAVGIPDNTGERFPDFVQIWRAHFQKAHARTGVVARGGDRMQNFVSQRGGQLSHDAHAIYVREIRLQLAQSLMLLLRAFAFRHIDVRRDHLDEFSIRGEQRVAGRFDIFDRSIGKYDSELECEISFLTHGLLGLYVHSLAIIWMYPLQYSFAVGRPCSGSNPQIR